MRIEAIDEKSSHLQAVKSLWRSHSDTLGFFPDGAFDDRARDRNIFVALDDQKCFVGYLLYRVGRDRATIVHLCVAECARKKGYSRALIDKLIEATRHLRSISLSCRSDFAATNTWPWLGFRRGRERPGRGDPPSTLVTWHLDHGHPDLFSTDTERTKAVIDANIFLDLVDEVCDESQGLLADWLVPLVNLCHAPELSNDLNRCEDVAKRSRRIRRMHEFDSISYSPDDWKFAVEKLHGILPEPKCAQDESDCRHVIGAVAAGADFLISRDGRLLGRSDDIYHATGLSVVRPSQFIGQLDALQRESEYQRQAVAGTRRVTRERVVLPDGSLISTIALHGERHNELRGVFHRHMADPVNCECHKVMDGEETLAVYVVERRTDGVCVPLIRICARRKPGTIARAVLTGLVRATVSQGANHLLITDPKLSLVVAEACSSLGFLKVRDGWIKLVLNGWLRFDEVSSRLTYDDPAVELLIATFDDARKSAKVASLVEHVLWPLKVSDSALPSFIVPIRPQFAEHLFDEQLASSSLFGADVDLALNPESAYYRSAKPGILTCPSRVMWYVSEHKSYAGSKTIRACSRLVELRVDLPSALHKRFRRLGVFDWKDVLNTAHGDTNRKTMGFRFDDTELIPSIRFSDFQNILRSNGVRSNLQSPTAIPSSAFGEIYALAFDSSEVRGRDHRGHEDSRASEAEAAT